MKKREIPPIIDFVDPRRVPYNIMDDPRYNRDHPDYDASKEPDWLKDFDRLDKRSSWAKKKGRLLWTWKRRVRYWVRPSTYVYRIGGVIARARRGWGEWDLDQYMPHSLDYLIAACDWHATKSWTYPSEYVDDPSWPENDSPDRGREAEGYREDLMKIKSGMQHVRLSLLDEEKCTCCGDYCRYWGDWKTEGCPIVTEAWALYTKLFFSMSD